MIKIAPSILSSDFSNLESELHKLEAAKSDWLHIDVMDGHFVNNITIGPPVILSMRNKTNLFFDVHLMISDPMKYILDFVKAGANQITFHYESDSNIKDTLKQIKNNNILAGLAIKPNTKPDVILDYLDLLDMILVMSVEPGFGGQKFIMNTLVKIKEIRNYIDSYMDKTNRIINLEVDGGLNNLTAKDAINSGANIIVAGSYIFNSNDYSYQIKTLKME